MLGGVCQAQVFSDVDFKGTAIEGFHLYGISAYSGYSSSAYPITNNVTPIIGASALGWTVTYGATGSVGYQRHQGKTNFSAIYGLNYGGSIKYANLNALNHSLTINMNRELTSKWTLSVSASGRDSTLDQLIYEPSTLSVLSQTPTSANNLAAALSVGQFSSATAAATLSGGASANLTSAVASSLVGDRVLSYGANASLSYAPTERWNIHFGAVSAGGEAQIGTTNGVPQQNYFTPNTLGLNAGVGFSYALSPRTQLDFDADGLRSRNAYQTAYSTTFTAGIGRKMGEHWFLRASGGTARNSVIQQASGAPQPQEIIGNGSLGFQTHAQTFVASYRRSSYDGSGLGVGTNTNSSGAWSWRRPGARWSVFSSFGYQQMANTGFSSFSGWSASAGLNQILPANMRLSAQYVYFHSSGTYTGGGTTGVSVNSIRVTVGWSPQAVQAAQAAQGAQAVLPQH